MKNEELLDWDTIVSRKGETRTEHIFRHTIPNSNRKSHGVFNGNPTDGKRCMETTPFY